MSNEELAKEILERLIDRPIFHSVVTEEISYHPSLGGQLTRTPVLKLVSVEARAKNWIFEDHFGYTDWQSIPLSEVVLTQKDDRAVIALPYTIFGTPYDQARVKYEYGLKGLPDDLKKAVDLVAEGIQRGDIDRLKYNLPVEVMEIVSRYRKGAF